MLLTFDFNEENPLAKLRLSDIFTGKGFDSFKEFPVLKMAKEESDPFKFQSSDKMDFRLIAPIYSQRVINEKTTDLELEM